MAVSLLTLAIFAASRARSGNWLPWLYLTIAGVEMGLFFFTDMKGFRVSFVITITDLVTHKFQGFLPWLGRVEQSSLFSGIMATSLIISPLQEGTIDVAMVMWYIFYVGIAVRNWPVRFWVDIYASALATGVVVAAHLFNSEDLVAFALGVLLVCAGFNDAAPLNPRITLGDLPACT